MSPKVILLRPHAAIKAAASVAGKLSILDKGGKDVFVHISAVEKAGLDACPEGAEVTFDIVPNRGKESAENLRVK
jgi:cold shock protein